MQDFIRLARYSSMCISDVGIQCHVACMPLPAAPGNCMSKVCSCGMHIMCSQILRQIEALIRDSGW